MGTQTPGKTFQKILRNTCRDSDCRSCGKRSWLSCDSSFGHSGSAGDDGHTSSIFPGQEDLLTSNSIYVVSAHPRNGQKRIAMTGYPIQNARYVIFLITGKNKADVVEEICNSGDTGPAAYVAHHAQNVELFMDKGAAAYIEDPNKKMS